MAQHSYPSEPPVGVSVELLWRLAHRMYRDHEAASPAPAAGAGAPPEAPEAMMCHACAQPWPCSGRRLAELGLIASGASCG